MEIVNNINAVLTTIALLGAVTVLISVLVDEIKGIKKDKDNVR